MRRVVDEEQNERWARYHDAHSPAAVAEARRRGAGADSEDAAREAIELAAMQAVPEQTDEWVHVRRCVRRCVDKIRKRRAREVGGEAALLRASDSHADLIRRAPGGRRARRWLDDEARAPLVELVADAVKLFDAFLQLARLDAMSARDAAGKAALDAEWTRRLPEVRRVLGPWRIVSNTPRPPEDLPDLLDWRQKYPAFSIERLPDGRFIEGYKIPERLDDAPRCTGPLDLMICPPEFLGAFDGLRHCGGGWTRGRGRPREGAPLVAAYVAAAALELLHRRRVRALPESQEYDAAEAAFRAEEHRRVMARVATDAEWKAARLRWIAAEEARDAAQKRLVLPTPAEALDIAVAGLAAAGRGKEACKAARHEVMRDGREPVPSPYTTIAISPILSCEGCETPCDGPGPKCRGRVTDVQSAIIPPQGRRTRKRQAAAATIPPTPFHRLGASLPSAFRDTLDALIRSRLGILGP